MNPHHGSEDPLIDEKAKRQIAEDIYKDLGLGKTKTYPQGQYTKHDEGQIRFAIASDSVNRKVVLDFGTPVTWLGMNVSEAEAMGNMLLEKAKEAKKE